MGDASTPTGSEAGSGLRMLPPTDPLADWLLALDEVEEQAKALVTSVRELRRKARDVSRAQRGQEKEFKSAAAVIDRLKKVANF